MKLIKLLTVPAVLLFSLLMAAPAFACSATITNLKATCNSDRVVCFDFDVTTDTFTGASTRDVIVHLIVEGIAGRSAELDQMTVTLDSNTTMHVHHCFPAISQQINIFPPASLTITITLPTGSDLDLGESQTSADVAACQMASTPTPTPTPTAPAISTPTATPTANTTAVLAQTGGFDFRFPLIGLAVIVAGLALCLVSVSRTRGSTSQK